MNEDDDCDICFDKMKGTATLECGHTMCISCCLLHFNKNDLCPFCRKQIKYSQTIRHVDTLDDFMNQTQYFNETWTILCLRHFEKNIILYGSIFGIFVILCMLFPNYKVTIEVSIK